MASILVVDDDHTLQHFLNKLLSTAGFSVTKAMDGVEALELLQSRRFDLVLLDIWMPRKTGLEVLAQLRTEPVHPKVIVMTADDTPETLLGAVREQAYGYVTKPFKGEELVRMVREALSGAAEALPIEVLSARPTWVELLVPCEHGAAERIQNFLLQLEADLAPDVRESVGVAFRELLLNAIEWGGELDPNRKVRIAYLRFERMLLYRIADPGPGFRFEELNHAAVGQPEDRPIDHVGVRAEKGMRPGGFGLLMVRANVDELIYNEDQNEVVFVKYLDEGERKEL